MSEDSKQTIEEDNCVEQIFSFWAKLMVNGDAPPEVCRYPSQTSVLCRSNANEGWKSLPATQSVARPIVELLDGNMSS